MAKPKEPTDPELFTGSAGDGELADQDETALESSLVALNLLSNTSLELTDMLTQVASFAVRAIPGADGAGLTLLEIDRADLIVKSEPFVRAIDEIQYSIGEGPCISAAATGQTKRSGWLPDDPRWPQFGPRAGELGIHSALSLPLKTATGVLGAMNVYAHAANAFTEHAQIIGETFALSAAIAVQNAQILEQTKRLIDQLHAGLQGQGLIDQAMGVLRRREGCTAEEAHSRLVTMSEQQHISVAEVAIAVVEGAVRRGRARRSGIN